MSIDDQLFNELAGLARSSAFEASRSSISGGTRIVIPTTESNVIRLIFETRHDAKTALMIGSVKVPGAYFGGDRTDLHVFISTLWGALLRLQNVASVALQLLEHPVVPDEIGEVYLFFMQPQSSFFDPSQPDYAFIEQILFAMLLTSMAVGHVFDEATELTGKSITLGRKRKTGQGMSLTVSARNSPMISRLTGGTNPTGFLAVASRKEYS